MGRGKLPCLTSLLCTVAAYWAVNERLSAACLVLQQYSTMQWSTLTPWLSSWPSPMLLHPEFELGRVRIQRPCGRRL